MSSDSKKQTPPVPQVYAGPEVAAIADVCRQMNVPFLAIMGVGEIHPSVILNEQKKQALIENAKRTLSAEDYKTFLKHVDQDSSKISENQADAYIACREGDLTALKRLSAVVDLKSSISDLGHHATHVACRFGQVDVLKYLLSECKLDPNARSFCGKRPLHYATLHAHESCVRELLLANADPFATDNQGLTALGILCPETSTSFDLDKLSPTERTKLAQVVDLLPMIMHTAAKPFQTALKWPPTAANASAAAAAAAGSATAAVDVKDVKDAAGQISGGNLFKKERVKDEEVLSCMICLTDPPQTIVLPCGHCVCCRACSELLKKTNDKHVCIRCRRPIESILSDDVAANS